MKKTTLLGLWLTMTTIAASAQVSNSGDRKLFNHMDLGVTLGTTGIGAEITMPAGDYVKLRTGFTYMPHFNKKMRFGALQVTENMSQSSFNRLSNMMKDFTGFEASSSIGMIGRPQMNNFKLLADIYPFKNNKHWHITAGFYAGRSNIAKAYNRQEETPSLMAVSMYNNIYWKMKYNQPLIKSDGNLGGLNPVDLPANIRNTILKHGTMGFCVGEFEKDFYATQDIYYDHDVYDETQWEIDDDGNIIGLKKIHNKGDIQYHKGELMYKAGDAYYMTPDQDLMVKAKAIVNAFRPYIGVGYNSVITKDKRTTLAVDCGIMMWGGAPKIVTHDGVDMMHNLTNVNGQVGDMLNLFRHFPIYPILEIRIARKLF
jgi:hypothetical protein